MPEVEGVILPFLPAGGIKELNRHPAQQGSAPSNSVTFGDIFREELNKLKFSGHAKSRMESREINLTAVDMQRLENAVKRVGEKGGSDSLVILDEKAFIVNVPNRTVVTVVGQDKLDTSVVTNIDSAVFA